MPIISPLLPQNATVCVAGANYYTGRFYMLLKDGESIIVCAKAAYKDAAPTDFEGFAAITKAYDDGLAVIQSVVDDLEFGKKNWARVTHERDGSVVLRCIRKPVFEAKCEIWAEKVDESEIEITKWLFISEWRGIWAGREVDLTMAWDRDSAYRVEQMTHGYKIMEDQGLDLTFKVLGHVTRRRRVIGIMTECVRGRPVQVEDRELVYAVISVLCQRLILFRLPDPTSSILITDGQVRFLDPFQVRVFHPSDRERFEELAELHYYRKMEEMFKKLDCEGNRLYSYHMATPSPPQYIGIPPPMHALSQGSYLVVITASLTIPDDHIQQHAPRRMQLCSTDLHAVLEAAQENAHSPVRGGLIDLSCDDLPFNPDILHRICPESLPDLSDHDLPFEPQGTGTHRQSDLSYAVNLRISDDIPTTPRNARGIRFMYRRGRNQRPVIAAPLSNVPYNVLDG